MSNIRGPLPTAISPNGYIWAAREKADQVFSCLVFYVNEAHLRSLICVATTISTTVSFQSYLRLKA